MSGNIKYKVPTNNKIQMKTLQTWVVSCKSMWKPLTWAQVTEPLPSTEMSKGPKIHGAVVFQFHPDSSTLNLKICRCGYWSDVSLLLLHKISWYYLEGHEAESQLHFSADFSISRRWQFGSLSLLFVNLVLIQKLINFCVFNLVIQAWLAGNLRVVWQHPLLPIVGGLQ